MRLFMKIIYLIPLLFHLINARENKSIDPVLKYYMDDPEIILECAPSEGVDCSWSTNTGNTYFLQSLPPNVERNDSKSCTIRFLDASLYDRQIWSCELDDLENAFKKYQIRRGSRPSAPIFTNDAVYLGSEEIIDWASSIKLSCTTVKQGEPAPVFSINSTGVENVQNVSNNGIIMKPKSTETEVNVSCSMKQQFLKKPESLTITLQLFDKPRAVGNSVVYFDDDIKKQIFKFPFVSNPPLLSYNWSFSNSPHSLERTSINDEKRYTALEISNEKLSKSLSLVIEGFNDADKKRFFYLELANDKGMALLGPLDSIGQTLPSPPIFVYDDRDLGIQNTVEWTESIKIRCTSVEKGIPPAVYSITVSGVKKVQKVANSSVILKPDISETKVKLTCSIQQELLDKPLTTTLILQLEDIPKVLGDPILQFDEVTNKEILKYNFISNPPILAYKWSYSNSSDINSHKTSIDADNRYNSLKIFNEKVGQSLTLTIEGYNSTDKERYFFLNLANHKGSTLLGPLSDTDADTIHDYSIGYIIGISIATLLLLIVSILLGYFLYKRSFSSMPKFEAVTN